MRSRIASGYQTVFSRERGSVAAPTPACTSPRRTLDALAARGIEVARITLRVGLGTFAPLRVERLDEVKLHRERYTLSAPAAEAIIAPSLKAGASWPSAPLSFARSSIALSRPQAVLSSHIPEPRKSLFLPASNPPRGAPCSPNFHLPQSSLLMLVSAFAGREARAGGPTVMQSSRSTGSFSYGDCMFIE